MASPKSTGTGSGDEPSWLETELAELDALREERTGDPADELTDHRREGDEEAE